MGNMVFKDPTREHPEKNILMNSTVVLHSGIKTEKKNTIVLQSNDSDERYILSFDTREDLKTTPIVKEGEEDATGGEEEEDAAEGGEEEATGGEEEATGGTMDITLHPNDIKLFSSLPQIKIQIEGVTHTFKLGFSNVLYAEDSTPYGILLSPAVQGRSAEIYVFEYK